MDEYMSNAWLSVSIPLCLLHGHVFDTNGDQVQYLESLPDILKWACIIVRLSDDLGTSPAEMARGDTPKAIQCYMNDTGASEEAAREHVESLVREAWKKLNKCVMEERTLSTAAVERLLNLVRAGHCFYQHGDGHGVQDRETKQLMSHLLFDPISS
uniref:Terpene synthase metal-binding domain-containing protein n=1 Tax=Kalanchoe fedtschenkoi TaxID=63787 RepID=A0A7N0V788_KALFE